MRTAGTRPAVDDRAIGTRPNGRNPEVEARAHREEPAEPSPVIASRWTERRWCADRRSAATRSRLRHGRRGREVEREKERAACRPHSFARVSACPIQPDPNVGPRQWNDGETQSDEGERAGHVLRSGRLPRSEGNGSFRSNRSVLLAEFGPTTRAWRFDWRIAVLLASR